MNLNSLLEAAIPGHVKNHEAIVSFMDKLKWVEGDEYMIDANGVVQEGPLDNHSETLTLKVPDDVSRIPVKFGDFGSINVIVRSTKLGSLINLPKHVNELTIIKAKLASLAGPLTAKEIKLMSAPITSLVGLAKASKLISLLDLDIASLQGIEESEVDELTIGECPITSLDHMPRQVRKHIRLSELPNLKHVRFPLNVAMETGGTLFIGAELAHKLSPRLLLVPGLTQISWHGMGYRDDLLKIFNKALLEPKTTKSVLKLQQQFIELDMPFMAAN